MNDVETDDNGYVRSREPLIHLWFDTSAAFRALLYFALLHIGIFSSA